MGVSFLRKGAAERRFRFARAVTADLGRGDMFGIIKGCLTPQRPLLGGSTNWTLENTICWSITAPIWWEGIPLVFLRVMLMEDQCESFTGMNRRAESNSLAQRIKSGIHTRKGGIHTTLP